MLRYRFWAFLLGIPLKVQNAISQNTSGGEQVGEEEQRYALVMFMKKL